MIKVSTTLASGFGTAGSKMKFGGLSEKEVSAISMIL
jgi:hypothetical protein